MAVKGKASTTQARPGLRRVLIGLLRSGKLVALMLAVVTGWGGYAALRTPRFAVQSVQTIGNDALSAAEVAQFADVVGQPLWYVETDEIERRISESPYVEAVKVRLQLPDAVVVTIRERRPNVRWLHDGQTFAVTGDGLIVDEIVAQPLISDTAALAMEPISGTNELSGTLDLAEPAEPELIFVSDVTVVDTTPNRPLKVRDRVDADAVELARRVHLRSQELPHAITRIEWDAGLGVSLIMGEGRQVVLGRSSDLDRKLATLRYVLGDGTQFKFLDLRPNVPYYR